MSNHTYTHEEIDRVLDATKERIARHPYGAIGANLHAAAQIIEQQRAEIERLNRELFSEKLNNMNYINERDAAEEQRDQFRVSCEQFQREGTVGVEKQHTAARAKREKIAALKVPCPAHESHTYGTWDRAVKAAREAFLVVLDEETT